VEVVGKQWKVESDKGKGGLFFLSSLGKVFLSGERQTSLLSTLSRLGSDRMAAQESIKSGETVESGAPVGRSGKWKVERGGEEGDEGVRRRLSQERGHREHQK
jgi:hypothetical protein